MNNAAVDSAPSDFERDALTSAKYPMLLFFDGECSFCNRWVARVMAADRSHRTRVATRQGPTFQRLAAAHARLGEVDSVVLVHRQPDGSESFLIRSAAIRKLIDGLPGYQLFAWILHLVPAPISDLGYMIFSKLRTPLFGKWHGCRVPIEENRELFLD